MTTIECPVCGHKEAKVLMQCKDYTVSNETFELQECHNCGMVYTSPKPEAHQLFAYYKSDNYVSHTDTNKGLIFQLYHLVRKITLKQKFELVKKHSKGTHWLDYGTGTGYFAQYAQSKGISIDGFEPDQDAGKLTSEKINSPVFNKTEEIPANKYDAITAWHVMEHVHNLNETMQQLHRALKENGIMIMAVPNHRSLDAKIYAAHWAAYDVPRHLYHFDKSSVKRFTEKHGFSIQEILPMKFDAYYVSMLSEKYKTGKQNLVTAFINGLKSNLSAKKTGEFSSLIYILKKI